MAEITSCVANVQFFPSACLGHSRQHSATSVSWSPTDNFYSAACFLLSRNFHCYVSPIDTSWMCASLHCFTFFTLISRIQATYYCRFRDRTLLDPVCGPDWSATVLLQTHTGHAAAQTSGCSTFWPAMFPLGHLKIKYYRLKGKFKQIGILSLETQRKK